MRAIHGLVVTGTRYVGLEFGIHGFQPYKVTQVLARKFGDCKDKATLMIALLREAGIDAELVLLRTRRGGRIEPAPASLAVFDHAIAYVPKLDLYLDGTAEFSGVAELPSQDQGVTVLRVGPRGSTLTETPGAAVVAEPRRAPLERGAAAERRGARHRAADDHRPGRAGMARALPDAGRAARSLRQGLERPLPGRDAAAASTMPAIEDRNQPVTVDAVASVPRLGQAVARAGDGTPTEIELAGHRARRRLLAHVRAALGAQGGPDHRLPLAARRGAGVPTARGLGDRERCRPSRVGRLAVRQVPARDRARSGRARCGCARCSTSPSTASRPPTTRGFRAFLGEIDAALAARIAIRKGAP